MLDQSETNLIQISCELLDWHRRLNKNWEIEHRYVKGYLLSKIMLLANNLNLGVSSELEMAII